MPGVPNSLGEFSSLKLMVLDKDGSVPIEISGLAEPFGQSTGHLKEFAGRVTATKSAVVDQPINSQAVDLYCDIKFSEGHGERSNGALVCRDAGQNDA